MVQMRLMGDDPERVGEVVELVFEILRDSGRVNLGDPAELSMRGPGRRIVVDVTPAHEAGPIRARAERVDREPGPKPGRALPPGRRRII